MRLLAYTSPARGHLYPVIPILLELRRRGHHASLCTLASQVQCVSQLGLDADPVGPRIEEIELDDYRGRSKAARGKRALMTFLARAPHEAPDLFAAIERHRPDALLIDVNCWGAAVAAEASGLPWAVYSPYLLPLPSRDVPPFGLGLSPLGGPIGRLRDALLAGVTGSVTDRTVLAPINALRRQYELPAIKHFADLLLRAPLLLTMTAEGFEYPRRDWPASVHLIGPVNWAPPDPQRGGERAADLDGLQDPLVLVTCSTERQRDERLVQVALRGLPPAGFSVVATTAAHDPLAFDAPTGAMVVRFLPHDTTLRLAACVVCHGGMGITQKALAAGIPVVVVPFGRDQLETARRVELAGAGVRLSPRRLTPDRLAKAVRTAIDRRSGAEWLRDVYARAGGAHAAADLIEGLAS